MNVCVIGKMLYVVRTNERRVYCLTQPIPLASRGSGNCPEMWLFDGDLLQFESEPQGTYPLS